MDTTDKCKWCKHWGHIFDNACDRVNFIDSDIGSSAFYVDCDADDDQGLEAWLMTGPDFCCIKFERK